MTLRSFYTLAVKEVHHFLPFLLILVALDFLSLLDSFFSQSPDELAWTDFSIVLTREFSTSSSNIIFLLGLIAGYRLFSHERQEQTQAFLWALPIGRQQLFWAKIASALCVLSLYFFFSHVLSWWSQDFAVNTIDRLQFSWGLWWLELGLVISIYTIGLCYGALVSYFRVLGIIAFGLVWLVSTTLASILPALNFIAISTLLQPEYRGIELLFSYKAWGLHSFIAAFCLFAANFLWTQRSEPGLTSKSKFSLQSRFALACLYFTGFIAILAYMITSIIPLGGGNAAERPQLVQIPSEEFLYSFYLQDQSAVINFIDRAQGISSAVQGLLNGSIDQQILVDVTDDNSEHLGIAGWRRLRMNRQSIYDPVEGKHVFAHEMTHVLADQLANRRLTEHSPYTQFFNEGLAEWVSYKVLPEEDLATEHDGLLLLAATSWQRLDMEFNDILFASSFASQFDQNAVYAYGLAWIESLSTVCGEQTPGKILQAMASPDLSQRVQGRLFWQTVLQDSQCDLTSVNTQFASDMEEIQTDIVPILQGGRDRTRTGLTFSLNLKNAEQTNNETNTIVEKRAEESEQDNKTYTVYVRVRDNPQSGPNGTHTFNIQLQVGSKGEISIPESLLTGARFQYQLGLRFIENNRPFFGRWIWDE